MYLKISTPSAPACTDYNEAEFGDVVWDGSEATCLDTVAALTTLDDLATAETALTALNAILFTAKEQEEYLVGIASWTTDEAAAAVITAATALTAANAAAAANTTATTDLSTAQDAFGTASAASGSYDLTNGTQSELDALNLTTANALEALGVAEDTAEAAAATLAAATAASTLAASASAALAVTGTAATAATAAVATAEGAITAQVVVVDAAQAAVASATFVEYVPSVDVLHTVVSNFTLLIATTGVSVKSGSETVTTTAGDVVELFDGIQRREVYTAT